MSSPDLRGKLELVLEPEPGSQLVRYVHDSITFCLTLGQALPVSGLTAKLRTTLGQARELNEAIVAQTERGQALPPNAGWRDLPMVETEGRWCCTIPLDETGFFQATTYVVDDDGFQHWPSGDNINICVHPNHIRSGNTIYCAFPRLFGKTKTSNAKALPELPEEVATLEQENWSVVPPSGTLRDLKAELPHIFGRLKCKWLHLLPVNPTPTTPETRMGRYGSPYAALDLTSVDPSLVEFDRRTTGVEQFVELADETHRWGGRLMLDLVINHTGWGSVLQENHPDFFRKTDNGEFESPGAWGTIWEDLVELDTSATELLKHLADPFLIWCERGVDGFRCDAGYKIPMPVWRYIVAKVRLQYPETIFLLEGLGGAWGETENLLTEGGMQWAYSELFQEFEPKQVSGYLDHVIKQADRLGPLVHYSETHDNHRLAKRGRDWSLLRNRLSALTSVNGGYGFTCGVEWLADQKIAVHGCSGLKWGSDEHLINELATLNELLATHPCFADGSRLTRLSPEDSSVLALLRESKSGDELLVLVNLSSERSNTIELNLAKRWANATDLLGQAQVPTIDHPIRLAKAEAFCLQHTKPKPQMDLAAQQLQSHLARANDSENYTSVIHWSITDVNRIVPVPSGHNLLIEHPNPFRVTAKTTMGVNPMLIQKTGIKTGEGYYAMLELGEGIERAEIELVSYGESTNRMTGVVELLPLEFAHQSTQSLISAGTETSIGLLTNGIGGMVRMHQRMGYVASKYDCVLGANLDSEVPVDRWVMVKRMRCWVNVDGFLFDLNSSLNAKLQASDRLIWTYDLPANSQQKLGDKLFVIAEMRDGSNRVDVWFRYDSNGKNKRVEFTVRFDLEDRSFHQETQLTDQTAKHFRNATEVLDEGVGFEFAPHPDRRLVITSDCGDYFAEEELCREIPHPVEASRGQTAQGDAYSPGWFRLPVSEGKMARIQIALNESNLTAQPTGVQPPLTGNASDAPESPLEFIRERMSAFVVRRGNGKTIIAGYPWFLDWGRDSLIAVRGIISDGQVECALSIVERFAAFEKNGTIPNAIFGEDDSNRETSDAPLWLALAMEELAEKAGDSFYGQVVEGERTCRDIVLSIAQHYRNGTINGIKMDVDSGLVFSPVHFTWMDTNHPAGTKREGYPIEIQALWIRLLRHAAKLDPNGGWQRVHDHAEASLAKRFWCGKRGWLADCLLAKPGVPATEATVDANLRCNLLIAVSLGAVHGEMAKRSVLSAIRHLVVPGAVRSLAPLPAITPHLVEQDGRPLNDPANPYWGQYEGDEDSRRKPAYHNGTAWTWFLPQLAEAIIRAWPSDENALKAARSYLASAQLLLNEGCAGQLPEILDGDAPHQQRGCDAQAWAMSELLRVSLRLGKINPTSGVE